MADNILSAADLEALRQLQERSKEAYRELQRFRIEVYPYMSMDDRVQFWAGEMERSMHWTDEVGEEEGPAAIDPQNQAAPLDLSFFDQHWYDECIGFDKDFDKILVKVAPLIGLDLGGLQIKRKK
ncbi:hypothetical protein GA0116948_105198 [Chitinophaga costaii]|uniref:Uncharacterized protein n=1 Tax=Chitinophaga costaii TaxID=1335309 RepID=A0A1C4DCK7_9BACT|nr:hypothetical protein [Chitinophaga costaii]SCC29003.1 hypothetical protein GA0116948_105198 [Chitinophaga costaii]